MSEPWYAPENQTKCPNTGGEHTWIWDEEQQLYVCDECNCTEDNQEEVDE